MNVVVVLLCVDLILIVSCRRRASCQFSMIFFALDLGSYFIIKSKNTVRSRAPKIASHGLDRSHPCARCFFPSLLLLF